MSENKMTKVNGNYAPAPIGWRH